MRNASEEFVKSLGNSENDSTLYSVTCLNAGLCWLALNKRAEAEWWFSKGCEKSFNEVSNKYDKFCAANVWHSKQFAKEYGGIFVAVGAISGATSYAVGYAVGYGYAWASPTWLIG